MLLGSCRNRILTTEPQPLPSVMMAKERPGCQVLCQHCDNCTSAWVLGTKISVCPSLCPATAQEAMKRCIITQTLTPCTSCSTLRSCDSHWDSVLLSDTLWASRKHPQCSGLSVWPRTFFILLICAAQCVL